MFSLDLNERIVSYQTIHWLLCAKRQLSIPDLITAVFIGLRMQVAECDYRPSKEEVLSACHNLVVVDEELGIFRVAHLSVREFFEKKKGFTLREANHLALRSCIFTLVDKDVDENAEIILDEEEEEDDDEEATNDMDFREYALEHWVSHCEEIGPFGPDEPVKSMAERLIVDRSTPTDFFLEWVNYIAGKYLKTGQNDLLWKNEDGNDLVSFPVFFLHLPTGSFGWLTKKSQGELLIGIHATQKMTLL
jgi:hypothetical protein